LQAVPEGIYGYASNKLNEVGNSYKNNTYKGIRLVSDSYSLYYAVWCTNEKELYNLKVTASPSPFSKAIMKLNHHRMIPTKP